VKPPRLGEGGGCGAVPRLYIVYPGICLTTEENHGKPQSGYPTGARLICAERYSLVDLAIAGDGLDSPLPLLAFASGDGVNPRSPCLPRKYLSSPRLDLKGTRAKRPECEAHHPPSPSVQVNNERGFTSTPP
jgi:hypothetical protein